MGVFSGFSERVLCHIVRVLITLPREQNRRMRGFSGFAEKVLPLDVFRTLPREQHRRMGVFSGFAERVLPLADTQILPGEQNLKRRMGASSGFAEGVLPLSEFSNSATRADQVNGSLSLLRVCRKRTILPFGEFSNFAKRAQ